jgi:hypothetical protein
MTSISRMEIDTRAQHSPTRRSVVLACMDMLRRIRVLVGVRHRLLVREPIGVRFLNRHWWRFSDTWHGVGAGNRHDGRYGHGWKAFSIWSEPVGDFLRWHVFVWRNGIRFLSRRTLCVERWFRYIGHQGSPGSNTHKLTKRQACSQEDRI